jgi:hypothetical protein
MILIAAGAILPWAGQAAAMQKQGISGKYVCACMSGITEVVGTCSTTSTGDNSVSCGKNAGDTCTATCKMMTFQKGLSGAAITSSPGAKASGTESGPKLRKAQ